MFLKHGFRAVRDAFICFLHGFAVLSTPLTIYLITSSGLSAYSVALLVLLISSLAHRFYSALLLFNERGRIVEAFKNSFIVYTAYIAFIATLTSDALRRIVERAKNLGLRST